MTPEQYAALRTALAALGIDIPVDLTDPRVTPDKLAEYHTTLEAKYQELRSPETGAPSISNLKLIRDAQTGLTSEFGARMAADEQVRTDAAALAALDAEGKVIVPAADGTPSDTVVIGEGVKLVDTAVVTDDVIRAETAELARVASLQPAANKDGGSNTGVQTAAAPWRTAAATADVAPQNTALTTIAQLGSALNDQAASVAEATDGGVRLQGGKVILASVAPLQFTPGVNQEGMLLRTRGADGNTAIIETVLRDHGARVAAARQGTAHTAAAPWCEPFDIIRAIPECVDASTPFRNSLPFIPMGHGGFQFNTGISLSGVAGAVDIWTPDDQAAIDPTDPDTWKRCIPIVCPGDPPTITLDDWITACLEWQVGTDLNNPERFKQYFTKLEALRARVTEQYLMALVDQLTINYKNSGTSYRLFGGLNDLVKMVMRLFQTSDYDERTVQESGYTMYLDTAQLDTLVAGELTAASAKTNGTRAGVLSYLAEKLPMIQRVVVVMDRVPGSYGTVGANGNPGPANPAINLASADIPAFVTAGIIRIIPTAEVFAFGTGELRTGVRQDFSYARQNKVGWFAEEAIALTKYGCRPWFKIDATLCSIGRYAGDILWNVDGVTDPFTCAYVPDNAAPDDADPFPGS